MRSNAILLLIYFALIVGGVMFVQKAKDSGAGQASGVVPQHLPPAPAVGLTHPEDDSEAGARFSTQPETDAAQGEPARAKLIGDETKSRAEFYSEFDEETMAPTAEALFARYPGLWEDPEFKAMPDEGLRAALKATGLPTMADCDYAMRSPEVAGAFQRALILEMDLFELATLPSEHRGRGYASCLELAENNWREAEISLMRELDRETHYKHWEILWRAWEQWSK